MKSYRFEVPDEALVSFVAALALGTLEAMRAGQWPLEAGIWTLGRPQFKSQLRDRVPAPLRAVLDQADELSALQKLCGTAAATRTLDELIASVRSALADSRYWYATAKRERTAP